MTFYRSYSPKETRKNGRAQGTHGEPPIKKREDNPKVKKEGEDAEGRVF